MLFAFLSKLWYNIDTEAMMLKCTPTHMIWKIVTFFALAVATLLAFGLVDSQNTIERSGQDNLIYECKLECYEDHHQYVEGRLYEVMQFTENNKRPDRANSFVIVREARVEGEGLSLLNEGRAREIEVPLADFAGRGGEYFTVKNREVIFLGDKSAVLAEQGIGK